MAPPVEWYVDDPETGAWVDLLGTYGRAQKLGAGAPFASPLWRGENEAVPRRHGRIWVEKTIDEGRVSIPIILRGANSNGTVPADRAAAFLENWRELRQLVFRPHDSLQLKRRLRYPAGWAEHIGDAEVLPTSLTPSQPNQHFGLCVLDFAIVGGYFYDATETVVNPGTVSIGGDARTRLISLTLPAAGTLSNTTLGVSVTVTAATTLTVSSFTATADIANLSWSGDDYWFVLAPGSNTITWSGTGTPTIGYRAAHL